MTTILLISLAVTLLFIVLIAGFLILSWHKKRQSFTQFEQLLADITDQQNTRSDALTHRFIEDIHIDPTLAQSSSNQLIAAEKLFLQHFINQQIQQQPLDNFYIQLCDLLDSYFSTLSQLENTERKAPISSAIIQSPENHTSTQDIKPAPDASPEPDWGDVFD